MGRIKWKNLWRAYRWNKRHFTEVEALAWIGFYSTQDRQVIEKIIGVSLTRNFCKTP